MSLSGPNECQPPPVIIYFISTSWCYFLLLLPEYLQVIRYFFSWDAEHHLYEIFISILGISELSLAMTFSQLFLLFSWVSLSRISILDKYRLLHLGFCAPDDSHLLLILPSWCLARMQFTQLSPCALFVRTRQLDENTLTSEAVSSSRRSRTSCLIYKSGQMGCQHVNRTWSHGKR